jgi:DeoR family transcriptional regulator, ulaG and ulaABCDEF operon transcriptional repressor
MSDSKALAHARLVPLAEVGTVTRMPGTPTLALAPQRATTSEYATAPAAPRAAANGNGDRNTRAKELIGREAAKLCSPKEAVMIDGGTTTRQMCAHLAGLNLQVLTNSLLIVNALLSQRGTRVLVPGGQVFPEQNIILSAAVDDDMPRFHAPKLFMGAAAIGPDGLVQADFILVAAERRLIDRAEQIIVLADSSKFGSSSGQVVCGLEEIDILITDAGVSPENAALLERNGVKLIVAPASP